MVIRAKYFKQSNLVVPPWEHIYANAVLISSLSLFQNSDLGTMPKRGRGRPSKGSSAQKKVKESADSELGILDNPSNVLEVDPGLKEKQEAGTYGLTLSYPPVSLCSFSSLPNNISFFCHEKHTLTVIIY